MFMSYDDNNIFAKILRGEIPACKVYEDEYTLAFMDVMPQSDGHVLVIPKVQATDLFEISRFALSRLIVSTQTVAKAAQSAFNADGVTIMQFNGAAAGQTVPHIHFHVIPRYEGKPLRSHAREMADIKILTAQAEELKRVLSNLV
jgi:histidine triad (HIT) family protein